MELRHIPGKSNGRADALSRRPDYDQGTHDNENVTVLPDHLFIRMGQSLSYIPDEPAQQDESILRPWIEPHNLKKINGEWWNGRRKVITMGPEQRRNIIRAYHDLPAYGHPGISRTKDLVEAYYWWPRMGQDVYDYVKGCADCQRHKVNTQTKKAPLYPITPVTEALPFQTIAMDFIVKLPESGGYDSILTITDHDCTKMIVAIPCKETINAEEVANLFLRQIFPRFGLPSKVISDRDPRFTSKFMKELCRLLGITQNISTAYHPRTDGQSERTNQWIEQYFRFWVNHQQDNWYHYLPLAEFAHNSWRNETTGQTPFETLMGYKPRAEIFEIPSSIPTVELRADIWKRARGNADKLIIKAQKRWAQAKRQGRTFKEGDMVWLEGRNLHIDQPTAKLSPKRHGPFPIKKVLGPVTYQLTLPANWKIHDVFHVDLLTPYSETDFHGPNFQRPPPDLIDGAEEYEVEKVLDSRCHGRGRKVQYLIKWKGYPDSDNQWVNWEDMHADEALETFRRRRPAVITHIRAVLQDTFLSSTTSMSTNASTVQSPILEGDAPLPFANANVPTLTQPTSGPTFTPAKMYHAWKNLYIHTPSKWRTPTSSSVSSVSTGSTDSLAPKEAPVVSTGGPGNTPYPTHISLDPAPTQSHDVASPTPTHFTISTPSPFRDIEHGSVLRPLPSTSPAPLPIPP